MLFSGFDLINWGVARLTDATNFLRSIPSFFAPKPSPSGVPFTPPFEGGQCEQVYIFEMMTEYDGYPDPPVRYQLELRGRITDIRDEEDANFRYKVIVYNNGTQTTRQAGTKGIQLRPQILSMNLKSGALDNCGNIPNPNPTLPIADDGLFTPNNPVIGDENGTLNPAAIVLSPAFPLALVGAILAGYAAALAAAKAAADALAAIKKVAEALESLKKLWEKLQEFLEEWEKDRPKNREIVRQTYGNIDGDGAIDFYPLNNKNFVAIQVDIVVTEVPIGFGKYFGNMSPSRYRYKELGYISFYSISQGIIETHSIQFKRSSIIIPKTAIGFIYHFGLDNKIKGFAFGTFSVRKT